jgi:tetratricopeptide (TPR) repeat protein
MDRFRETEGFTIPRPEGVFAAITGTLSLLSEDRRERLSPLGYVADVPIPLALFEALTGLEETAAEKLCEECGRQSILTRTGAQVRIHSLTIAAIAATNAEGGLETAVSRSMARLASINKDDPEALRGEIMHHERIKGHARRFLGVEQPDVLEYANKLAVGYHSLGRYEQGRVLFEETVAIRERVLGAEHPDTLESRLGLASCYYFLGRHEKAVAMNEVILAILKRVMGSDNPHTLRCRSNLANGYRALGQYENAVNLDEETMSIQEKVLGSQDPDTLHSRYNLALGYRTLGHYEKALALDKETLSIMERVLSACPNNW